jgi:hypothetical protein
MLSRTDWSILPTFRMTFSSLSQCQAVDIDPKQERNFTEDLNFPKHLYVKGESRVICHLLIVRTNYVYIVLGVNTRLLRNTSLARFQAF